MSIKVVPAIIPTSLTHLTDTIRVVGGFCSEIQVDVVDGVFVENVSWPYGEGEKKGDPCALASLARTIDIELDLMIHNPLQELPRWIAAGAKRAIVHMESCSDIGEVRRIADEHQILLGIASQNHTPIEQYLEVLPYADYAQCMGIPKIGVQGQPFDERVLERIAAVREVFRDMEIAVDGSVNHTTAVSLTKAGATRLVSGSAILHAPDPKVAYRQLCDQVVV